MLRAAGTGSAPRLLAASAVAVNVTGTVAETALATVTIPAGSMGLNGGLLIYTTCSMTNNANSKAFRIRLGGLAGTQFMSATLSSVASYADIRRIRNRNSASSQVSSLSLSNAGGVGSSTSAIATGTVDTTVAQDLVISVALGVGTDTATLENYEVWLLPGA